MRSILRRDIDKLSVGAEEVEKNLETLARNHTASASGGQIKDLMQLIEHIKRLETDMSTILCDFAFQGRQYQKEHNLKLIHNIHYSCNILNNLNDDIKKIMNAIKKSGIYHFELQKLFKDWNRFKKSIRQVQKSVQFLPRRRKNNAWEL